MSPEPMTATLFEIHHGYVIVLPICAQPWVPGSSLREAPE
jgi:hypothetical protein